MIALINLHKEYNRQIKTGKNTYEWRHVRENGCEQVTIGLISASMIGWEFKW